ncbi:DNA helicase [Hibiscus syriacus]|uniref:DNA helicase n=1 Tax=Hibiscus syriacus TaxID=106335 RepID=A0A6A3B1F5_HIBSY|nr:DNA helicase [Hibiscus syriacus]
MSGGMISHTPPESLFYGSATSSFVPHQQNVVATAADDDESEEEEQLIRRNPHRNRQLPPCGTHSRRKPCNTPNPGAGSVFMGILPNGKIVAVKRLIYNTRQWVDEFFNEVNLISRIQHTNLLKLLGCSIEGPEGLLVYDGYMAPEYLVRVQLTEKADVYSFGILVLEIVCGKRNTTFSKDSASLVQTFWTLYRSNRLGEAVDCCIRDEISAEEAPNYVLQVGPVPSQPPFLNANVKESESSTKSYYSSDGFMSNEVRKIQGSATFSESSRTGSSDDASKTPS